jgi:hypothetical protein
MGTFHDILRQGGTFGVRVDYYDDEEAERMAAGYGASALQSIAGTKLSIPVAEFLTYCLFVNKRTHGTGLRSYSEIKAGLNDRLGDFNDGLEPTPTSLRTSRTGNEQLCGLSEKIGVGVALSVLGRVHGLCEADWERIPQGPKKSLDFEIGSNGSGFVQVEAKGSSVPDNTCEKGTTVSGHAVNIRQKKASLRADNNNAALAAVYGSIGVIDSRKDGVMRCWLLDPLGAFPRREAKQQQVLNRLHFIAEILEAVLPQSLITVEIYKRLSVLASADDVFDYDNIPLSGTLESREQALFFKRTYDLDRQFSGVVIPLKDGSRFFYGLRKELLQTAHAQNFHKLLELKWQPTTTTTSLVIAEAASEEEPTGPSEGDVKGSERRPKVELARVHTTSSGRVFGLLGLNHERKDVK